MVDMLAILSSMAMFTILTNSDQSTLGAGLYGPSVRRGGRGVLAVGRGQGAGAWHIPLGNSTCGALQLMD